MIPENIPHRFKSILTAMAQQTEIISQGKRQLKKHARFKPREFPWILNNAFMGKEIPVFQLRNALKYRQVSFYKEESLACKDDQLYMEAIKGYGELFQNMGYKGFIVLFDEAESIMLTRINQRSKSYSILHELLCPDTSAKGFMPVFAFTHEFFSHLKDEDFERTRIIRKRKKRQPPIPLTDENSDAPTPEIEAERKNRKKQKKTPEISAPLPAPLETPEETPEEPPDEKEVLYFAQNYSKAWQRQNINIYTLRDLTSKQWHILIRKLIQIHALAYQWQPDVDAIDKKIFSKLLKQSNAESRMKLKLIVNILDLDQQQMVLSRL